MNHEKKRELMGKESNENSLVNETAERASGGKKKGEKNAQKKEEGTRYKLKFFLLKQSE